MLFCCPLIFSKLTFLKKFFHEYPDTIWVSNSLGPDQAQTDNLDYQQITLADKDLISLHVPTEIYILNCVH